MRWYDPLDHAYYVGNQQWLSVTQVLAAAGKIDGRWFTPESRSRGSYVHAVAERMLQGQSFERLSAFEGYVAAIAQFQRLTQFTVVDTEAIGWDDALRVAGRVDVVARTPEDVRVVIDWKTGGPADWHLLQVAQYAKMKGARDAWVVYLSQNGKARRRVLSQEACRLAQAQFQIAHWSLPPSLRGSL